MNNHFKIIVIDDNPDIQNDFIKILLPKRHDDQLQKLESELFDDEPITHDENSGFPVFEIDSASQGEEGFNKIKNAFMTNNPYSVAFVDIRMPPGWDGIETIKHIWDVDKDIQIVICTAYTDYSWDDTVKQLGLSDNLLILKKPFDDSAVKQIASALARKWLSMKDQNARAKLLEEEVKENKHALEISAARMRTTMETSNDGIIVLNQNGQLICFNNKIISLLNIPEHVSKSMTYDTFITHLLTEVKEPEVIKNKLNAIHPDDVVIDRIHLIDGRTIEYYTKPEIINQCITGRMWNFQDITNRILLEQKLEFQATHDLLTSLPNRALLFDRLRQEIANAKRHNLFLGIIYMDLDRFKLINDSYGHNDGDKLLIHIANKLQGLLRNKDTVARVGGDEFILYITDMENEDKVLHICSSIIGLINSPVKINNHTIHASASLGVSVYPRDGESADDLIRNADIAMYKAKEIGGNQAVFYKKDLEKKYIRRLEIEADLHNALIDNEFTLYYQPQYIRDKGNLVAFEALIRWKHPKDGLILPLDFIYIAEDSGLIIQIGEWVLKTACAQMKAWEEMYQLKNIRMAVNISMKQFRQTDFVDLVKKVLATTQLDPSHLEIEISEEAVLSHPDILQTITELKNMGIYISLDDFGTGQSSFKYIKTTPVDRLKIDKSFIANINHDKSDEAIIKAIIEIAHNMNLKVVAEGIETQEQIQFLQNQRCTELQGYYFAKPMPANEVEVILKSLCTSIDTETKSSS